MTDKVDDRGYFVLDRHAIVTVSLDQVTYIFDLEISHYEDGFQIVWCGSYGVAGTLRARRIRIDFEPGKPERPLGGFALTRHGRSDGGLLLR